MEKEILEKLINENKSSRQIAAELNKSQTSIKYWLKKFNLKTKYNKHNILSPVIDDYKICTSCSINKHKDEYHFNNKSKTILSSKCKMCKNKEEVSKLKQMKKMCLEYKGHFCTNCNYSRNQAALEFHHLDPNEKEFEISNFKKTSILKTGMTKELKEELDKCIVLCSNCHRELHSEE